MEKGDRAALFLRPKRTLFYEVVYGSPMLLFKVSQPT